MTNLEKLYRARELIESRTGGRQQLALGWDGMPAVRIEDPCMVGVYFALIKNMLTEQGSLQTAKIRQVIGLVQENADKNIAPEDLQTFYRVLEQLLNNFEEMSEHYDTVFESLRREI